MESGLISAGAGGRVGWLERVAMGQASAAGTTMTVQLRARDGWSMLDEIASR